MSYPGNLSRFEIASGLLVRSIKINGFYLFVESCNINQDQDIELVYLVQGGPGGAIANIGSKKITGQITCPVRVNRDGEVDPAIKEILKHSENPMSAIRIDTNHVLSHLGITAENGGTDNNELLSIDSAVVSDLQITASPDGGVKINATIIGMIDEREPSDYIAPSPGQLLGREIHWNDCDASRKESQMRSVSSLEINIKNEQETFSFIPPITTEASNRKDQIDYFGTKFCKWGGEFKEVIRLGADKETHIHGGWMQNENLIITFGPIIATITCPLFKIAELPLTPNTMQRNTKFLAQIRPNLPMTTGGVFSFVE